MTLKTENGSQGNQILETEAGQSVKDWGSHESWGIKEELTLPCTFLSILHSLPLGGMLESNFTLQIWSLNSEGCSPHPCLLNSHGTLRLR